MDIENLVVELAVPIGTVDGLLGLSFFESP
jgi:hypothetical protein